MSEKNHWSEFYEVTKNRDPREMFMFGLQKVPENLPRRAIEIGFGSGNEVLALLDQGWYVFAVDAEKEAADMLRERSGNPNNLEIVTDHYQNVDFPSTSFIHAGFALPFCEPKFFDRLWNDLKEKLTSHGIFAGQLFGKNDEWKDNENMTFHDREEIDALFSGFSVIKLDETQGMRKTATGKDKYWHFFDFIIQKN